nr:putative reverse transcriptase, RNA-dependent DNA polymerase [Tanacetum cinerariifolium]
RYDNGTEFKNYEMNQLCGLKRIKREFSNGRTPQQNRVAKRKNRILIEAARTMLADSLLPIPFWAEAVNIAYYVHNRVLVTKPHNKTLYELLIGREPIINFMRPFGCPVTILNTLDHLGKFYGKANEGFLVGYSINSKAFKVYNSRTKKVEENCIDEGVEADYNNLETEIPASPIPSTKIHKDHPKEQIIGEMKPKKVTQALDDESWVKAMQEELLQFKLLNVWTLVDLPHGKRAIGTKWVYKNKNDQRRIIEVYVSQPPGFVDLKFPDMVYKVEKALYGLHQAPRAGFETLSNYLLENGFKIGTINKTLFIKKIKNDILLVQVYVDDIIFGSTKRYLKGHPTLGLWYPKDSPLELISYSDIDYAGASLDRKSTTGGCQFLGSRLISWQCKKQTIVVNSKTEVKYIATSSYCGQVLWLQNQLLDYGYNFIQTKIHVDNESAICVVKNHVYHSKTKHIEIRHHFIRDSYKKRLIEMVKMHTDSNVADLLTKAFDVTRFQFLVASIGLLNP